MSESINKITKAEIEESMEQALKNKEFVLYFQPQFNHSTGLLVGAEELIRWNHPKYGILLPKDFIPVFEENGFITKLDMFVFEEVCKFTRRLLDEKTVVVPISCNFSRRDFFDKMFVSRLEDIRKKYDIPVNLLRIEITETIFIGDNIEINGIIDELHKCGYIIEMDDFGSGYSSLNTLKDIEFDILKLDMMFLYNKANNRAGKIVDSIVRMAKWLEMPVIAEGLETIEQADFLRSIGCEFVQGFLYSRPLTQSDYEGMLKTSKLGAMVRQINLIERFDAGNFWNPASQETLIFNNFVGGAAIFIYEDDKIEVTRVNQKYLKEFGMNMTEKEVLTMDPLAVFDDHNKKIYLDMLKRAIKSNDEEECETWRTIKSPACKDEKICIRANVRLIGRNNNQYIFYSNIRNITKEKEILAEVLDNEKRFKFASEQVNIYYWEYTVATKEMRPCFRCMRDLGLPPLVENYPEPAIAVGIIPPDYADMYRDWHIQIENGVKELEAVIPLTVGRIPFKVRYTTEFDSAGNPIKAYGSAALIVE